MQTPKRYFFGPLLILMGCLLSLEPAYRCPSSCPFSARWQAIGITFDVLIQAWQCPTDSLKPQPQSYPSSVTVVAARTIGKSNNSFIAHGTKPIGTPSMKEPSISCQSFPQSQQASNQQSPANPPQIPNPSQYTFVPRTRERYRIVLP